MKILTCFVFAGLAVAQEKSNSGKAVAPITTPVYLTPSEAFSPAPVRTISPLSKTDLLAIDSIAQRAAAVDRDKQELITEICSKISVSVDNCSIDVEKRTVSVKPVVKPESAPLRTPVK